MPAIPAPGPIRTTLVSLCLGALGAGLAWGANVPLPVLVGPAAMITLAALAKVRVGLSQPLPDICFLILGLAIGTGFDSNATAAMMHWPLAFVALAVALVITLLACRALLQRHFGFDARSAVLASAPGHLSFVMSIAADSGADVGRIAVVQSIRLLSLTLIVPFLARAMGVEIGVGGQISPAPPMPLVQLGLLALAGWGAALLFRRLSVPAPMVIGPMVISGLASITGLATGSVPAWLVIPAFLVMGVMIGARFSGITLADLTASLAAGLCVMAIGTVVACIAAVPVAWGLGFPLAHVLTAFAPGGLETMIALGAALGASPGFIAACHISRVLILTVLIPFSLGRARTA